MAGSMTIASSRRAYLNLAILALFWMLQSRCTYAVDDVSELASSIITTACEASDSDVKEFYTSLKSSYSNSQDQQYPPLGLGMHCIYSMYVVIYRSTISDPTSGTLTNRRNILQRPGAHNVINLFYDNIHQDKIPGHLERRDDYFEW